MKKSLLLLFAMVFGLVNLNAQEVTFGVKAGVNFSDITGDDVDSFKGLTALHVGVMAEIEFSEKFSFQPELMFSAQGSDYEDTFDGETYKGTVKTHFINVPLMAKYYVIEGLSIEAGPQIGLLLSAKDEYEGDEEDLKDYLKSLDIGLNFGLGYKLDNGLNFAARYNLGLTDFNDDTDFLGDSSYKNSVIQLSVGFFF